MAEQEMCEKVIKGLECCLEGLSDICPYKDSDVPGGCKDELMYDILMLLKVQEPVEPVRMNHTENKYRDHYRCPICKEDLSYEQNYCPDCGRKVKWQ